MNLNWMFFGSLLIGFFLNAMNLLAYRFSDLYFSLTLFYSALLMALWMCLLELLMYYHMSGTWKINLIILFSILTAITIYMLRQQILVTDNQWLRRMISHHSTALTTSHQILKKTDNPEIKKLAADIIETQEREIKQMVGLLGGKKGYKAWCLKQ